MESPFEKTDTRNYQSDPISNDELERVILLNMDALENGIAQETLIGILAISFHCSREKIAKSVDSLIRQNELVSINGFLTRPNS